MQQGKKRKLVNMVKNGLDYMRLDVDDDDNDDYYEDEDIEATKKDRILTVITILASFIMILASIVIAIAIVVDFSWF